LGQGFVGWFGEKIGVLRNHRLRFYDSPAETG
jgi:hypothetical protein